jgi:hypothetical protein
MFIASEQEGALVFVLLISSCFGSMLDLGLSDCSGFAISLPVVEQTRISNPTDRKIQESVPRKNVID